MAHLYSFNSNLLTPPFVNGCNNQWLNESSLQQSISKNLKNWLFDRGSLTSRLQQQSSKFEVIVLNNAQGNISAQEQRLFGDTLITLNCREVLLVCNDIPQVYARSLIPHNTLESSNVGLKGLGNNSLGQILFQAPQAQRQEIAVSRFDQQSTMAQLAQQLGLNVTHDLWGRRSLFNLQQYPLLVSEVFLPNSLAYQEVTS